MMNDLAPYRISLRLRQLFVVFLLVLAAPATAAVQVDFYSKEFGSSFPHAYVRVTGTLERSGERIDQSFGFTAKTISPAILFGSVAGEIVPSEPEYIANSERHFSLELSDEEYDKLIATVERWRTMKQPSYNLNRRNCVFFVAEIARVLGMKAETPKSLMKKPYSYIRSLITANGEWLRERRAEIAP